MSGPGPGAGERGLTDDPHELNDLVDNSQHRAVLADLRASLAAWQKEVGDPLGAR